MPIATPHPASDSRIVRGQALKRKKEIEMGMER
jgi:hypothetical protein